jgi:Outer membrane receptor proteins, mostly Fe transport
MRRITTLFICVFSCLFTLAQERTSTVTISVANETGTPVEGLTAELLSAKDSILRKTVLSDQKGVILFDHLSSGSYFLKVSGVAYKNYSSSPFQVKEQENVELASIKLQNAASGQMQSVTVTGKKPFIQKLNDRIVVNVDNSVVNVGSAAMDVLERSPGVTIDQNDVISLRGRQGVIIMIDGKPSPMTGADLANYLRSLPSNAIDRIDIITNPSSKYDAAGNSGIIDIHLKKDQRFGTNGSLTAGYGQGIYPKANAGFTFNYRNNKLNVFGNYNNTYRVNLNHLILNRNFYKDGVYNGGDDKDNYSKMPLYGNTARLGMDYSVSNKTIVGFVVNTSFYHFTRDNENNSIVNDNQKLPSYTFQTYATNNDHNNNTVGNINFKHTFDSTGKEIKADIDYGVFNNASLSYTATHYFNLDGSQYKAPYILDGDQTGKLTLKTGKVDYVHPLKKGAKLELGFKTSYVSSDNDARFTDMSSGIPENDTTKTNHFIYNEYNNAGYVNFSKEYKKFNIQFGLRGERTDVNTYQVHGNQRWDSGYFQLFPSAFFNYKLKEDQTIGLSVSRRIQRPGYADLNPFLFLIDVTTYATGNPSLLPEISWSYEASYTVKQISFSLGYSHTSENENIAIARLKDVLPNLPIKDSNVTIQIPINLNSSDYVGLTIAAPIHVNNWWNMINNVNVYYNHFNGDLGGSTLNNGSPAADVRTNNTFTFKKGWSAELNAAFSSGGRYGYMVSRPNWGLSTGVQKNIWKNKGLVKFNITDIFWTNLPRATITYPGTYIENWHAYRESRVANISFTYRFGNNKVQAARRRTTGSEEERQRAGG